MNGVVRTRVGYAGGTQPNPTYQSIKDHTEAIQIVYDPSVITYEDLVDVFWTGHVPTQRAYSRQYMSLILYDNEEQKAVAERTKQELGEQTGQFIYTEIVPLDRFYTAEGYHQKYYLQSRSGVYRSLLALYPDFDAFVDSTTAARVNGYIGGYGTREQFEEDLQAMELPEGTADAVRQAASRLQ